LSIYLHEYDDVDLYTVWETVHTDLPPLIDAIEGILQTLEDKAPESCEEQ